jgi:hypothetical protein
MPDGGCMTRQKVHIAKSTAWNNAYYGDGHDDSRTIKRIVGIATRHQFFMCNPISVRPVSCIIAHGQGDIITN